MLKAILWLCLVFINVKHAAAFSFTDYTKVGVDMMLDALDWAAVKIGYDACPYVENPMPAITNSITKYIVGQDRAIKKILNITSGWEMNRHSAIDQEPLVLIFTGDTGVGKSETAYRFGNALLSKKTQRGNTRAVDGVGFLNLRGEQFSQDSQAGKLGVAEVQRRIAVALIELLEQCHGRGVVVFDEVQKVIPGSLDVFLPMIEKRGQLSVFDTKTNSWKRYPTENLVIIFTTDVGGPKIRELMLLHGGRDKIPDDVIQDAMHSQLNATWGGNIKKFVKGIIPFLPLGNEQMKSICKFGLSTYGAKLRGKKWFDFVVDDKVIELLADSEYLYEKVTLAGPVPPQAQPQGGAAGGSTAKPYFYKSTLGARGLENGAAGPVFKLKSLIGRTVGTKFRPAEILHVGVVEQTQATLWGTSNKRIQVYLQWCTHTVPEMFIPPSSNECSRFDDQCQAEPQTQSQQHAPATVSDHPRIDLQPPPTVFVPPQPSEDQRDGLAPWINITLSIANDKKVCETILVEEWEKVMSNNY